MLVLPAILRHLRYHISNRDDLLDKCLTVLGAVMKHLHDQDPVSVLWGEGRCSSCSIHTHILRMVGKLL